MVKKRSVKKTTKNKQTKNIGKIPIGVQVVSILFYIGAALSALLGLFMMLSSELLLSALPAELELTLSSTFFVILGAVFIGIGVLNFFIGRGLWKLKSWARILAIILACFGALYTLASMLGGITITQVVALAINIFIGGYLIFSKEVKKAFK